MGTFKIEIRETLSRIVEIESNCDENAKAKANEEWNEGKHILDGDDFQDVSFHIVEDVKNINMNKELETNIGKYCYIKDTVVIKYLHKVGKIVGVIDGPRYEVQFPDGTSNKGVNKLYPHPSMVEIINKIYTIIDAKELKSDIDVLLLPKRVWCDSKETLSLICGKLAECHIGTSINYDLLFIQT